MKKGQLMGQPLVYVFIAIVAVLILVFGLRMVFNLQELSEDVTYANFYGDVKEKFDSVYTDSMGSVVFLDDLKVPNSLKEICFMDRSFGSVDLSNVDNVQFREILQVYSDSDFEENVFVYYEGTSGYDAYEMDKLVVVSGLVCDSLLDSKVDIKFINQGQSVEAQHI